MIRRILVQVFILLDVASTAMPGTAAAPELKSVRVDLPEGDRMFPDGPGADAINNNCLACHSADMVLNQPALSRQTWNSEVKKMIEVYKAPVDSSDVTAMVDYLTNLSSNKSR